MLKTFLMQNIVTYELKTNIKEVRALIKNKQLIKPQHKSLVKAYFTIKFFEELIKKTKIPFIEQNFIDEVAYMKEVVEKRFTEKKLLSRFYIRNQRRLNG